MKANLQERHESEKELLRFFLNNEQKIRKENPPLFWQLVDRLTTNRELIESPGQSAGVFIFLKSFTFSATV